MTFLKRRILHALKVNSMLLGLAVVGGCVDKTPVPPPKVTRDTGATERFLLTLTIEEPVVFGPIEAYANYSISNRSECVPMDHSIALGGVRHIALEKIDLAVKQVGEGKFRAEALKHPFLAEDYYALGVCRWVISGVTFRMHHAGVSQTVGMARDDIKSGKTKLALCFLDPPDDLATCGSRESVRQDIRNLFFPVSIESHKD